MTERTAWRALTALALAAFSAVLVLSAGGPVEAAFPGKNGKIAYHRAFDSWSKNPSLSSQETKLLDDAAQLVYSPDGSRVAFVRDNPGAEIFVANSDGTGTPIQLTRNSVGEISPAWSPDGSRIVYKRENQIWTMNADGSAQTQLTSDPAPASMPAWSVPLPGAPDGKIAFVRGGKIWTMLSNGAGQAELSYTCPTENGGICDNAVADPAFSPDGTEIAAAYFGDIFVMPSGGGTTRVLLPGPDDKYPGQERDPAWSPDGARIAFEHDGNVGGSPSGIYWAKSDGSSPRAVRITAKTGEVDPDWQPLPRCTITGTAGNDTGARALIGSPGADVICGLDGNDTINGKGGGDIVLGGAGNDRLIGDLGNDILNGGPGSDTALFPGSSRVIASLSTEFAQGVGLDTLPGVENLSGSNANDRLTGNRARNALSGLGGNDFLDARDGAGGDKANGGTGTDTCRRDAGDTLLSCP